MMDHSDTGSQLLIYSIILLWCGRGRTCFLCRSARTSDSDKTGMSVCVSKIVRAVFKQGTKTCIASHAKLALIPVSGSNTEHAVYYNATFATRTTVNSSSCPSLSIVVRAARSIRQSRASSTDRRG
ncbi:hypothetical protein BC827DRAFT_78123 [Russula dissimulans]|nr:hypothetical protein BC827DRAFT_253175 [Russula dissimulans]KAH9954078.1 hypothetical protein BC827DRAFT_78123 [Russula dissimulans]